MNLRIKLFFTLYASCLLSACTIGNGRICGPQTPAAHCDKEAYERLKYPKPYGAHWIKEGMTKESRLDDTTACGSGRTEYVLFSEDKIQAAKKPEDPNDIKAMGRLTKEWAECMRDRGYVYLEYCDERCQYP
ncbi:hypothetical protein [Methylophaga sp.]|jgi:hypothetical protein|uniref:hypothetical protein n=1 Tax=Methylophaga sp. TaxID=2024840 RepID=UPI003A92C584